MRQFGQKLQAWPTARLLAVAILLVIALAILDRAAIPRMSFTLFHVLTIALVGWRAGFRAGLLVALLSATGLTYDEWSVATKAPHPWVLYWNLGVRLGMFVLVAYLSSSVGAFGRRLQRRVEERTVEIERVNTELRRSRAALQKSETLYRELILNQGEGLGIVDADERFTFVNPAGDTIFGVPPGGLVGRSLQEFTRPEEFARVREQTRRRRAGERSTYELEIVRPDGERRNILITAVPHTEPSGQFRDAFVLFQDITERKRTEARIQQLNETLEQRVRERTAEIESVLQDLRAKDTQLDLALTASHAGIWSWDVASNEAWGDDRYRELYGFTPGEPMSYSGWLGRVHPGDRERLKERIGHLMEANAGQSWDEEFRALHPTKGLRWIHGIGRVERDEAGRALRFSGLNLDITTRRQAAEALHESEARYRELYEGISDAFVRVDLAGRIQECNRAYQQMLGYSESELRSLTYRDVTPEKWHAEEARIVAEETLVRGFSRVYEKEYRHKNGTVFPIEVRNFRVANGSGQPVAMWGIVRDITERKEAERALRESEKRFRAIFEQAAVGVAVIETATGRFRQINQRYCEMIGRTEAQMLATDFMAISHPADLKPDLEQMDQLKRGVIPSFSMDKRLLRPDDSALWIHLTVSPMWSPGEAPDFHISVVEDINDRITAEGALRQINLELDARVRKRTADLEQSNAALLADISARKATEEALRRSEQRFQSLFENCPDGVLLLEADGSEAGRILDLNTAAARLHGYDPADLIGRNVRELEAADSSARTADRLERLRSQQVLRMEVTHRRKDGSLVPLEVHAVLMRSGSRRLIVTFDRDISARRQAEEQLRKLSRAVEQSPASVVITDPRGNIEHVNAKFIQVTGYALEEVRGQNPRLLKSGLMPAETYSRLWQTIAGGREWRGELFNRKKNGERFWEAVSISPIVDEAGHITHFVGIKEDITARKRTELWNTTFSRLGAELAAAGDAKAAARIILDAAQALFSWDAAFVHLYDARTNLLLPIITVDTFDGQRQEIPASDFDGLPTPLSRLVMEHGAQLLNRGKPATIPIPLSPFGNQERPSESRMYVAIRKGDEFIGILSIQSYTPNAYDIEQLASFRTLADYCSATLQRINAVEALRDSEERFRTLFESSPIAIALHEANGHILETNTSYQSMVGYSGEELRQLGVKRIMHPEDVPLGNQLYQELVTGKRERYRREKRYRRKDGALIWGAAVASAIRDPDGRLRYIISIVEDITERKRAELATRELAAIVEHSSDAIFSGTLEGNIASWNNAAVRLSGYQADEVIGQPISVMLSPDRAVEAELILNQLRAGNRVEEFETLFRRKDGEFISVAVTASPVRDLQGRVIAASAIARDITERKRLEQEILRISTEERRRIGHELHDGLGQLLTGISFKTKALQGQLQASTPPAEAEAGEIVTLINGAIRQTRQLAQGLDPIEIEAAGLIAALRQLAEQTRKLFRIECTFTCHEEPLRLNDHAGLVFYRITQEAISNAHTHGAAHRVQIHLARNADRLELRVENDGRGFSNEPPERPGMGLRIMQHRARSIGGTLTILAGRERGATVICSVPLELCLAARQPPA